MTTFNRLFENDEIKTSDGCFLDSGMPLESVYIIKQMLSKRFLRGSALKIVMFSKIGLFNIYFSHTENSNLTTLWDSSIHLPRSIAVLFHVMMFSCLSSVSTPSNYRRLSFHCSASLAKNIHFFFYIDSGIFRLL